MRRTGFTLIELLVVIAIISILASILFPVFSRAREKGRQAACISNQKQIVLALLMYAEDYDELLPPGEPIAGLFWYDAIYAYTHNHQIMYCPDRKDRGPGYGMNYLCSGISLGQVWDAAGKILIGDVHPEAIGAGHWPQQRPTEWWINDPGNDLCTAPGDNSFEAAGVPQRHNDGVVYGYLDGHVKWGREKSLDRAECWVPWSQ